jgi:hypothetical protein
VCDDPEKCESISEMVGYLTLATIDTLKKQDVFKPDSDVRNLGTVFFMLIRWGRDQSTTNSLRSAALGSIRSLTLLKKLVYSSPLRTNLTRPTMRLSITVTRELRR